MGEAKRRTRNKPSIKEMHKSNSTMSSKKSWLQFNKDQASAFVAITTRGAWIGISTLIVFWIIVRFIGPIAHWWKLSDIA